MKKSKLYVGIVGLSYIDNYGLPTLKFVSASYNTKKELVDCFLPYAKKVKIIGTEAKIKEEKNGKQKVNKGKH